MKWTKLYSAVALLGMVSSAVAGSIQQVHYSCGADKACGVAPACQPECCRPTICRPDCPRICTYQRNCGAQKPNCCGLPTNGCCVPKCGPARNCCPLPVVRKQHCCPTPCATANPCCRPVDAGCGTACGDAGCGKKRGWFGRLFGRCCKNDTGCCETVDKCCEPVDAGCAAPACAPKCCETPACGAAKCCPQETLCCDADPCEVAHWIYVSQTACYAKERAKAIDRLGDRFDCRCNPEIMCAFIHGLNDSDERVRFQAAEEIRQQVSCHQCCCNDKVVAALTCALADCDRKVRREAERALCACGYDVIDCPTMACGTACGNHGPVCGNAGCGPTCGPTAAPVGPMAPMAPNAAPAPKTEGTVAPPPAPVTPPAAPAAEPEAYFPSKLKTTKTRSGLKNLFGLR